MIQYIYNKAIIEYNKAMGGKQIALGGKRRKKDDLVVYSYSSIGIIEYIGKLGGQNIQNI